MILLISTSDTDLLSARAAQANYRLVNPRRVENPNLEEMLKDVELIIFRFLGSPHQLPEWFQELKAKGLPLVVVGGEQAPDAALMELSSVPIGVAAEAHRYLAHGGAANLRQLALFLQDTVLLSGDVFEAPQELPVWGVLREAGNREGIKVGIIFYRAQYAAGNTDYVEALADAVDQMGGVGVPIFTASLREAPEDLLAHLKNYDVLIMTVLAAGGAKPALAGAGEDDGSWDVAELAALDLTTLQGLCLTWSKADWEANDDGMSPLDVATQVAVPEFDGRITGGVFSFKEFDDDGLPYYAADVELSAQLAKLALKHGRLRHLPNSEKKLAIVLSAYPTKHSRIGNAVGLDTPASLIRLLDALRAAGYDLGAPGEIPGTGEITLVEGESELTTRGNALIHALIAAGGQDEDWLTQEQLSGQPVRIPASKYQEWFAELPVELQEEMVNTWGEAPGTLYVDDSGAEPEIVSAALRAGNIVILVQPPRGFGQNPIAIYHDPDLALTHHYLATYRWLTREFGVDAIVHVGKHGNLEWLPGKGLALSTACAPNQVLDQTPLIYPFLVNDPGEGSQAKRRAHAVLVDHLVPPMSRAESYGDIARLEQLLDEYANVSAMDPAKAPALRSDIWTLIQAAKMHHDLGLEERPEDEEFDEFIMHIDGWLCEIKDVQIRDGLHTLGLVPEGEVLVNLVLAMLRAEQVFMGTVGHVAGLRQAMGLEKDAPLAEVDAFEAEARELIRKLAESEWSEAAAVEIGTAWAKEHQLDSQGLVEVLRFAALEIVPRILGTTAEIDSVLHALNGGYIAAGPSGSPLRGLVNVLPTGRNFYSIDPKAIPSQLAWATGQAMADSLVERYLAETGAYPKSVGLSVWGTSAMRTAGDDIAEVLALIGVRPIWDPASRRVVDLEVMSLEELGRPRIDVTVRISGFFRDAFPHAVTLLDDAVQLVAGLDENPEENYLLAHAKADLVAGRNQREATTRIFGSKPGSYGAGLLEVLESGNWRTDEDLAEVYAAWGGFAYGRGLDGVPARGTMETNYRRIQVAAKNIDSREHDIADSDDYFQFHGGMVAAVRSLTGTAPKAYVGDSTSPEAIKTRSLAEETSRVFRARVVNPRWLAAMRRHGYKGAFEMAATVDYLFGFDATASVIPDWMYEKLASTYILDQENQEFLRQANPWALNAMIEKLHEAVERELWAEPDPELLAQLQEIYLDVEGELE